jgi:tetratricopeptide (TPR) repeat protein
MPQPFPRIIGTVVSIVVGVLLAQEPPSANAYDTLFQLGMNRLSLGKYQEAEDTFRRVAEMEPGNSRGTIGIAQVYLAQKRQDEALRVLQEASEKAPTRPELHYVIGNVAVLLTKYDLAIAEFQRVLDATDKNSKPAADLYFRLGEAYRRKGDLDFSISMFEQAQKLLPENAAITNALAFVLDAAGHKPAAEAQYRKLVEADPQNALAMNNLAFLLADQGKDLDLALAYAHRARQLAANEPTIADTLGWVDLKLNNTDEAIAIFRDVVQKGPDRAVFHYHLASALAQKGDSSEAVKELEIALKNSPSPIDEQQIKELLRKIGK